MAFFKNIGQEIKEIATGSDVAVGDVGKFIYIKSYNTNFSTDKVENVVRFKPIDFSFTVDAPDNKAPGEYDMDKLIKDTFMENISDFIQCITGERVTESWDHIKETHEVIYMVKSRNDIHDVKRADAVHRHMCNACAFKNRCNAAPECGHKNYYHFGILGENAVYFYAGKDGDTLIDKTIERESSIVDYTQQYHYSGYNSSTYIY